MGVLRVGLDPLLSMKKTLTKAQADVLRPLWGQKRDAENAWKVAMILLDVDPDMIVNGDLSADEPYILLATPTEASR